MQFAILTINAVIGTLQLARDVTLYSAPSDFFCKEFKRTSNTHCGSAIQKGFLCEASVFIILTTKG